jgi:DNA-binding response OmpR family regulator
LADARSPMRVLVADEDDVVVELVTEYLRGRGQRVWAAHEGREAADLLQRERLDLLVVDEALPQQSGLELCALAARLARPVSTVLLSARPTVESCRSALLLGAADYLVKPFRLRELYAACQRAAQQSDAARARSAAADRAQLMELAWGLADEDQLPHLYGLVTQVARAEAEADEVALWVRSPHGWDAVARGGMVRELEQRDPTTLLVDGEHPRITAGGAHRGGALQGVLAVAGGEQRAPHHRARIAQLADLVERVWAEVDAQASGADPSSRR